MLNRQSRVLNVTDRKCYNVKHNANAAGKLGRKKQANFTPSSALHSSSCSSSSWFVSTALRTKWAVPSAHCSSTTSPWPQ